MHPTLVQVRLHVRCRMHALIRAEDSSSWTHLDGSPGTLPAGLSLTCGAVASQGGGDNATASLDQGAGLPPSDSGGYSAAGIPPGDSGAPLPHHLSGECPVRFKAAQRSRIKAGRQRCQ